MAVVEGEDFGGELVLVEDDETLTITFPNNRP